MMSTMHLGESKTHNHIHKGMNKDRRSEDIDDKSTEANSSNLGTNEWVAHMIVVDANVASNAACFGVFYKHKQHRSQLHFTFQALLYC